MRVRLSYSVELEEVPTKLANILEENLKYLPELTSELESVINRLMDEDPSASNIIKKVDKIRINLANLDSRLGEVHSILEGYSSAMNPQPQAAPESTEEPTA